MAKKKEYRTDGTYIITQDANCNPKLGARLMKDGTEHLFLDYYFGKVNGKAKRKREYLPNLFLIAKPSTPIEREHNKENLNTALDRRERQQKALLEADGFQFVRDSNKSNFISFFALFLAQCNKKSKKWTMNSVMQRFQKFLMEYNGEPNMVTAKQMDKSMMQAWADYLQEHCQGGGAKEAWAKFKQVIYAAIEEKILRENPCKGIIVKTDDNVLKKAVLTAEEIQKLSATPCSNIEVKKAALFSYYSALRWVDVKALTWGAIDVRNSRFTAEQQKTKGHSSRSVVSNLLPPEVLQMLGEPKEADALVFSLPCYKTACRVLKKWACTAEIDKHITWHCFRHSVATELLRQGNNIKVVSEHLGHSSLRYVEKYVRALDEDKKKAISTLPKLNLNI